LHSINITAEEVVMNITTVGLDLAKNIITVCALNAHGDIVVRRSVSFGKCAEWLQQLPRGCVVGIAYSGHRDRGFRSIAIAVSG
jgi:hypothetical protein